ncbi:putative tail length tape-measure protein [Flavobacterium phage FL-1]|nr:putative tail length tape-measure protein [Flavobacterium phage FL-1]
MGVATMRVPTIFTAVDHFSGVVSRMTAGTAAFGRTAEAAAMRASRRFNSAGTTMLYTGAAIATGLGYAVNEAMKYEKAVASLAAVTGTETGSMNKQIEDLAISSRRSAIEVAKSFEIVGSKMSEYLDNPEALKKITGASIVMAEAANMKLEPAIDSLTGVLNIFGKQAEDAMYIVNKLSAGEIVGSISIAETSDVLRQFGATARLANVQVDESVALIQALTKSLGIEGVGRGIRNLMVDLNMVGAFDKNKTKALQKAGVDMSVLGNKSLDLVTRLKELKKLEGNSAAMGMFFKKTGIQTGATLFQNFDDYIRFLEAIKNTNKAQEQAAKNNNTLSVRIRRLKDDLSNMAIKIGEAVLPAISQMIEDIVPLIKDFTKWSKENKWLAMTLFRLVKWLLILGVISKLLAITFYGVSKAIAVVSGIMKAYTFISSMAALANVSFGTALWGCVTAMWAFYWPLLLVGAAIVAASWSAIDMVQHWEDWKDITLLLIGPLGWIVTLLSKIDEHSSNIKNKFAFEGWFGGIKAIGALIEDLIVGPMEGVYNILSRAFSFIPAVGEGFKDLAEAMGGGGYKPASQINIGTRGLQGASGFANLGGMMPSWNTDQPKNLAGQNNNSMNQMLDYMQKGTGGALKIDLTAPPGYGMEVDDSSVKGIPIVQKPNQGTKGL